MKAHALATAFGAAYVSLTILFAPPVYGQACTPSSGWGQAARSGASLTNPAGETIVVNRRGERGLDATESATNHGTIITCGEVHEYRRDDGNPAERRAHAVSVVAPTGDATAVNSGLIETRGRGARGLISWTNDQTATATATNRGRVVTRGDIYDGTAHFPYPRYRASDGVTIFDASRSSRGDAIAVNERNPSNDAQSGVIEVHGTGARGIFAYTTGTGEARGINRGDITTHGDAFKQPNGGYLHSSAGIAAESERGDATAINEAGATIRTHGDGAPGLLARIYLGGAGGSGGRTARAENRGTIVVSGDFQEFEEGGIYEDVFTTGVYAHADNGTATVVNTGNVTAAGQYGIGLYAGDGSSLLDLDDALSVGTNATVRMTAGRIVAGAQDNPATAEDDSKQGFGVVAESERGRVRVMVSGASTSITAHSTDNPDPEFSGEGIGIYAGGDFGEDCEVAGGTCASDTLVEISGGATVTADIAVSASGILNLYESRLNGWVEFGCELDEECWRSGTNDHFTIRGGSVYGDVDFYGGNDTLTITGDSRITGDINFGEGTDTLVFHGPGTLDTIVGGQITGLENLISTAERTHVLPLFPAASGAQQGFVRIVNTSDEAGEVQVLAFDDAGTKYGPLTLAIGAGEVRHVNSHDLETGNAAKGLTGATGRGEGHWRLVFESDLGLRVMGYVRTADGFLTSMHDEVTETASDEGYRYEVVIFNPGGNIRQVSVLRVVNRSDAEAAVTITGLDDAGEAGDGAVELTLPAGAARMLEAPELESGGDELEGALGDGLGKWRLTVASDRPLAVMSLLRSPTGHLTNLSTVPSASR